MLTTILRRAFVVPLGAGILMAASASGFSVAQAQEANVVVVKNFMFSPMSLTIKAGSTVTWKNLDGEPHTVVNDAGLFRSGALDQNDTYKFKFDKPGVYSIFCGIHPNMKATITVQ
ncbi:cupredoxin family copper-binding protein [Cupriavidus sp. CV2]|uniref:cupredoxin domain-containing protein n=1 Tax=Cupriavidus ulmosensis TaxID=3065913 RepID=UPI00296AB626|nr:cupredoxin family copper-binding protein [Cupriavidus sp. CV2]MDW3685128.1 cupredoxin family copper-binding protein [Cupriavidus sp. CV2]